jgi:hypothetical protein
VRTQAIDFNVLDARMAADTSKMSASFDLWTDVQLTIMALGRTVKAFVICI